MFASALFLSLATAAAQSASNCGNPTLNEVNKMSDAARLRVTACMQHLTADALNAEQAKRHDPRMTMTADVEGTTLRYNFRLALDARQISPARLMAMLPMLKENLCADGRVKVVMSNGGKYRYIFKDRSGQVIRDVLIDHC